MLVVMVTVWMVFLFYVWGSPILSVSLLLLLIPVSLVFAYIRGKRAPMLLPIAYFVFASAMFFYISGYCIPLLDDRPLERFAEVVEHQAEEGDLVGVGSNHISYHRLNTYLEGHHVSKVYVHNMSRKSEKYPAENSKMLQAFLSDKGHRVFCVITSEEYAAYVPEVLRERLYLLDEAVKWRKIHKLKMPLVKDVLTLFFNGDSKVFLSALREDILLVSNRP